MYKNRTYLAVIPARGGSKRLPNKNILDLHGKPLIAWSIEAGLNSKYVDEVVVSSDSNKVLKLGAAYKAKGIKRPEILASDTASTFDALKHTLDNVEKYDYIVLLQPTSPLRNATHIDAAIHLLEEKKADAIVSVCPMEHSPLWSNTINSDLSMKGFLKKEIVGLRSQDLDEYFRVNGAIYICKIETFLREETFFIKDNVYAFKMDRESSVDIDEEIDFQLARVILER